MEATTTITALFRSPFGLCKTNSIPKPGFRVSSNCSGFDRFGSKSQSSFKNSLVSQSKLGPRRLGRKCMIVRASSSASDHSAPIAPLQMESPVGQFLSQILISNPHLLPAAVERQLEQLQTDRDAEQKKGGSSAFSTDLVLYRRIAEVKANERRQALEEILYASIVQKFIDANVSLVPVIVPSSSDSSGRVDRWPSQSDKLEQLHSPEACEMIQNHLGIIMGSRLTDSTSVAQVSKLKIGQVYAASVMYGYFLKRIDQRFQLEKAMKILPHSVDNEGDGQLPIWEEVRSTGTEYSLQTYQPHPEVSSWSPVGAIPGEFGYAMKESKLRNYVMTLDGETLQRYASIRSREAVSIIDKHTEALFGRPEAITPQGTIDSSKDELVRISFGGLKRLVLEAVTFGSFLWDVESYVDSKYQFVMT